MTYFWVLLGILLVYSAVVTFYCIRWAMIILKVQDSIEGGLRVLDEKYIKISEILERPLFYDSPEVRQVLSDLGETREMLNNVAKDMSANLEEEEDES